MGAAYSQGAFARDWLPLVGWPLDQITATRQALLRVLQEDMEDGGIFMNSYQFHRVFANDGMSSSWASQAFRLFDPHRRGIVVVLDFFGALCLTADARVRFMTKLRL
jgi:hypothetical protein